MTSPASPHAPSPAAADGFEFLTESGFPGRTVSSDGGVSVTVLANGCVRCVTVGQTLVNLILGDPLGGGMHRLYLRRWADDGDDGRIDGWRQVLGTGSTPRVATDGRTVTWTDTWDRGGGGVVGVRVALRLHDTLPAWWWDVRVTARDGAAAGRYDAILVQDLGLAGRGQVQKQRGVHLAVHRAPRV